MPELLQKGEWRGKGLLEILRKFKQNNIKYTLD